jgi:hypothetical protein
MPCNRAKALCGEEWVLTLADYLKNLEQNLQAKCDNSLL